MKITAEFESVDFADIAASAIRNSISKMSDIKVSSNANPRHNNVPTLFGGINFGSNPAYPFPVASFVDSGLYSNNLDGNVKSVMQVICRQEEAKKVTQIIIGHGGRNISKI